MNKKGFTLIELLVVIAIIGILSSIAIVYLGDARNKANDAKVKSNITTAATQVELDRANGDDIDAAKITDILAKLGDEPCTDADWSTVSVEAGYANVAFYSRLCSDTTIFCADSQGYRGIVAAAPAAGDGVCTP